VGRGAESAVRLDARNVSRCHARLTVENGTAFVEDLGSRNGTLVNGQPLRGRRKLREGDVLQLADEILRVEDGTAADTAEPAAPTPTPSQPPPLPGRRPEQPTVEPRLPGRLRLALSAALRALSGKGA
jgi:pSer/pThr/pTyr-binding forkhead associated (FHA) protein